MAAVFAGLMSGTSLDGIDGALIELPGPSGLPVRVLAHEHRSFAPSLREQLLALNTCGNDELHRAALAGNALALAYAEVVSVLLQGAGRPPSDVRAVGMHGQTVRHRPREFDGIGYTLQIGSAALLAERIGIDVVADFRSRDLAAGGQGAPLVPAFHRAMFARPEKDVAVVNVGGIANVTLLGAGGTTRGFDCGPGNVLMDAWSQRHLGLAFDASGRWAASGAVDHELLAEWLREDYFALPPPKSTGRDRFNAQWLDRHADASKAPEIVQATLAELTARSVVDSIRRHAPATSELLVCGGGAANDHLMNRLQASLPGVDVSTTERRGLPPQQVEAVAFAWLAHAFMERRPGNLPAVTGAAGERVLGALYPAR